MFVLTQIDLPNGAQICLFYGYNFRKGSFIIISISMKLTFAALFLLLLSQALAQHPHGPSNNILVAPRRKGRDKQHKENQKAPGVRKCETVKCAEGFFCFHGRCKRIDYECIDMKCSQGFRCNHGKCVEQMHAAKKQICKPLGFEQERVMCTDEFRSRCLHDKSSLKACGYTKAGSRADYSNGCEACSNEEVKYFFGASCMWGPVVCKEAEECLNGVCRVMFTEEVFKNNRICNENSDCKFNEHCAGHKCMDRRDLYNYMQSLAETKEISVAV